VRLPATPLRIPEERTHDPGDHEYRKERNAGKSADRQEHQSDDGDRSRMPHDLTRDLCAEAGIRCRSRDDDTGRGGDHQGRDLGDDTVTDGQQRVRVQRVRPAHAALADTHREPADDVDYDDEYPRNRIALDEPAGTIHCAVEVGFPLYLPPPLAGLGLIDQAHVEVRVDAHLLAWHRIEGEARGDLRHTLGAVRDDDVLNDYENYEYDQADDIVSAHHVVPDRADHMTRVRLREYQARRRDIHTQPEQRCHEEQRREGGELERPAHVERKQQDEQGTGEVGDEQEVEQARRDGSKQDQQDAGQHEHEDELALLGKHAA